MKTSCAVLFLLATGLVLGQAATLYRESPATSPVTKVVNLLEELKAEVEADGKREQKGYDKFACWCEETMARKASDIAKAKEFIETTTNLLLKLSGEIAAHAAEIAQLKKDIEANLAAQKAATDARDGESGAYEAVKGELEQSIGALEQAIRVLSGAGTGKGGFLQTVPMQQATLISVAADIRRVLSTSLGSGWAEGRDLTVLRHFLEQPQALATPHAVAAVQTGQNPFGDYAPQSTGIQGILKSMYDSFAEDLEKANGNEAGQQKAYVELMETKQQELATLQATLQVQEADHAAKSKLCADSKSAKDKAQTQLEADEAFFEDTKASCKSKAAEWAERTRLRTEELKGFQEAIAILNSPEAKAIFSSAHKTFFLQLSGAATGQREATATDMAARRAKAYAKLRELAASQSHSVPIAELALALRTGGHFDKVITMIDHMVELIRKEEQDDIKHRDRCQSGANANSNTIEDLEALITKTNSEIARLADRVAQTKAKVEQLEDDIAATEADLAARLAMRNSERAAFEQAVKDDTDAIGLIQQAIKALQKFYKSNNIPLGLAQLKKEPTYTVSADTAPDSGFGGSYGGRSDENGGIVHIMEMIAEDLQKEIKTSTKDEQKAQKQYEADRASMNASLKAAQDSKVAAEQDLADLQSKKVTKENFLLEKTDDLSAENEAKETLGRDCAWVETHFDSRRDARKAELSGLAEAKSILAGASTGEFDELALAVASSHVH